MFVTTTVTALDPINRHRWNAGDHGDNVYSLAEWLETVSDYAGEDHRYIQVQRNGRTVGGAAMYLVDPGAPSYYVPPRVVGELTLRDLDGVAPAERLQRFKAVLTTKGEESRRTYPWAVICAPFGYSNSLWWDGKEGGDVVREIMSAFHKQANAWAARSHAVLYERQGDRLADVARPMAEFGYTKTLLDCTNLLKVNYTSLEQYLSSFSSKNRRKFMHEHLRFTSKYEIARLSLDALQDKELLRDCAALAAMHYGKFSDSSLENESTSLRQIRNHMTGLGGLLLFRRADQIDSFHIYYVHNRTMHSALMAMAPGHETHDLFFNNIYELIEIAIEEGMRFVDFGSGGYVGKLRRGCTKVPLYGWLRSSDWPGMTDVLRVRDECVAAALDAYPGEYAV